MEIETQEDLAGLVGRIAKLEERVATLEGGSGHGAADGEGIFEILDVDGKMLPHDGGETVRFSWRLVVQSHAESQVKIDAQIQFVDMNSFAIEEHEERGLVLTPGKRHKFTGIKTVSVDQGNQIMGLKATATVVG